MNKTARGSIVWSSLIILVLVAALVLVFGLYVRERSQTQTVSAAVQNASGQAQQTFQWRLVTSWPKNFPGLGLAPENFARIVNEMSDGRLKIQVHGAGEIVPALGVFDAVSSGSVEMGHTAAYYYKGIVPASPIFTAIPFGMNVAELDAWIAYGGGLELWRELYQPFNIRPFVGGNTGMQMAGWFNRPINSTQDVRGLKMRIPGIAGEVFSRVGGAATTIAGGDLYTSMQTGVIDATEWVGPYNDRSFGLHEVGTHYYYPGWHETSAMLEFQVNLDAWNALPKDLKAIIEVATNAINHDMQKEYNARNADALDALKKDGIQPKKLPDDVMLELAEVADQYYENLAETDASFAKIYASYSEFKARNYEWNKISEKAIYEYRELLEERSNSK